MKVANESIWFEGEAGRLARFAIIIGVLVHLAGFIVFKVVARPVVADNFQAPFVSVAASARDTETLEILAALSDSEPLFLPTRWNATTESQLTSVSSIDSPFDIFPEELTVNEYAFTQSPNGIDKVPQTPADALMVNPGSVFSSFGTDFPVVQPETKTGPMLELFDFQSGERLYRQSLNPDELRVELPAEWRFAEFQVIVNDTGILGKPLLITSSDQEGLDKEFARFVQNSIREQTLAPGYYKVVVGP